MALEIFPIAESIVELVSSLLRWLARPAAGGQSDANGYHCVRSLWQVRRLAFHVFFWPHIESKYILVFCSTFYDHLSSLVTLFTVQSVAQGRIPPWQCFNGFSIKLTFYVSLLVWNARCISAVMSAILKPRDWEGKRWVSSMSILERPRINEAGLHKIGSHKIVLSISATFDTFDQLQYFSPHFLLDYLPLPTDRQHGEWHHNFTSSVALSSTFLLIL